MEMICYKSYNTLIGVVIKNILYLNEEYYSKTTKQHKKFIIKRHNGCKHIKLYLERLEEIAKPEKWKRINSMCLYACGSNPKINNKYRKSKRSVINELSIEEDSKI
jgi:hypothetical protein